MIVFINYAPQLLIDRFMFLVGHAAIAASVM